MHNFKHTYTFDAVIDTITGERYVFENVERSVYNRSDLTEDISRIGIHDDNVSITPQGIASVEVRGVKEVDVQERTV